MVYNPIGQKFVLHSVATPYHPDENEDRFVVVTVVETKEVPMSYDKSRKELGWRAEDKSGKSYTSCWTYFPDDSSSPRWAWWQDDAIPWYDITQGIYEVIPFRPKFMDDPEVAEVIYFCDLHGRISSKDDSQAFIDLRKKHNISDDNFCFSCLCGHKPPSLGWKGWR